MYYYLDNNFNVVKARNTEEWLEHWDIFESRVAEHQIDGIRVSTVFLGIEDGSGDYFETMVFIKDGKDVYMRRYTTWDEAVEGHNEIVKHIREGIKKGNKS